MSMSGAVIVQDPLLSDDTRGYSVFFAAPNQEELFIHVTHRPSSNEFSLTVGRAVEQVIDIAALAAEMRQKATRFRDATSYINHVVETIRQMMLTPAMSSVDSISKILEELAAIGWEQVVKIDEQFQSLELRFADDTGRQHTLVCQLPTQFPAEPPSISIDLPVPLDLEWPPGSGLADVLAQAAAHAGKFMEYFEVMDDIDQHAHVLEPTIRSYAIHSRRIAVAKNCSILVDIDPRTPKMVCPIKFFGIEKTVQQLRQSFNKNVSRWSTSCTVRENLEAVLDISFPSPQTANREELTTECAICYAYVVHDEGLHTTTSETTIPDFVCANGKCCRSFHRWCLLEWLQALPSTRVSFDTVFGMCPYCSTSLAIKL